VQIDDRPVIGRDLAREALASRSLERPLQLTVRRGDARMSVKPAAP
jgi:hypothetical protein